MGTGWGWGRSVGLLGSRCPPRPPLTDVLLQLDEAVPIFVHVLYCLLWGTAGGGGGCARGGTPKGHQRDTKGDTMGTLYGTKGTMRGHHGDTETPKDPKGATMGT